MTRKHNKNEIRRTKNGSIDHASYLETSSVERSRQAFKLFDQVSKLLRSIFQRTQKKAIMQPLVRQEYSFNATSPSR